MHENPYQSPAIVGTAVRPESPVEELRRAHIRHEASIKSVAVLYVLGSLLIVLIGVRWLLAPHGSPLVVRLLMAGAIMGLGVFQFWVAWGLQSLKSWTKIPVAMLSGIGLFAVPIGTLINAYILYLVFSRKGRTILSEDYQQVIAATPHIKYKTSIIVWIFLGLLVALLAIAFLGIAIG